MKMLIFRIMLLVAMAMPLATWAQRVGEWRSFPAYHNASQCELFADQVFVVSEGSLYSYFASDDGIVTTYAKHDPLSDTGIFGIKHIQSTNELVIVYRNGNIDIMSSDCESIYNVSELQQKSLSSKQINDIWTDGKNLYIAASFGIVTMNVAKREFSQTYMIEGGVESCVVVGGTIYAATQSGLRFGRLTDNLLDKSAWQTSPLICQTLRVSGQTIAGLTSDAFVIINADGTIGQHFSSKHNFLTADSKGFIVGEDDCMKAFSPNSNQFTRYNVDGTEFNSIVREGNTKVWVAAGKGGLQGYRFDEKEKTLVSTVASVIPDSPIHNYANYMFFRNGKLLVTGGGIREVRFERPGTFMELTSDGWRNFTVDEKESGVEFKDIMYATEDPQKPGHYWAGSAGEGLYEFSDYKFSKLHTFRNNQAIGTIFPGVENDQDHYMRVNGVQYDRDHNLWILNAYMDVPLRILKDNGEWMFLPIAEMKGASTPERILFDSRGWAWIVLNHVPGALICYDYGTDISNTADDKYLYFPNTIVNQDGVTYSPYYWTAIAEDHDGAMWLGTANGLFCIANPQKSMNTGVTTMSQVKVPRNDGTNTADYLLSGVMINDIAVDGANRKWIATTSGVYCVSADGIETINHFTSQNSPLPNDNVSSIAINEATGEVFMGSEEGIVSYMTDAVTPAAKLDADNVYASPNPVAPDYQGIITVRGLIDNSYVKITTASGTLIAEGRSNGGLFTWNGCTADGRRVVSGVYYVMVSNDDMSEHIATRIVMVR